MPTKITFAVPQSAADKLRNPNTSKELIEKLALEGIPCSAILFPGILKTQYTDITEIAECPISINFLNKTITTDTDSAYDAFAAVVKKVLESTDPPSVRIDSQWVDDANGQCLIEPQDLPNFKFN